MIKEYLDKLDTAITNKGIIQEWAGISRHMTDKDKPYGISLKEGCKGNIYGANSVFPSSAYMYLSDNIETISSNRLIRNVVISIIIELYSNYKLLGEEIASHKKTIELHQWLWANGYQNKINSEQYSYSTKCAGFSIGKRSSQYHSLSFC